MCDMGRIPTTQSQMPDGEKAVEPQGKGSARTIIGTGEWRGNLLAEAIAQDARLGGCWRSEEACELSCVVCLSWAGR
jgi:hypothetical protein